jgi:predicted nucleic acid-binding protein
MMPMTSASMNSGDAMTDPVVVCDANVLYSILLTDLVLSLGEAGLFRPRWTQEIHEEWMRSVLADQPERQRAELERRRRLMDRAIDDDLIEGYEAHLERLSLPDPDDRHVLAAAIEAGASLILTFNLRDFPARVLEPYGVRTQHPDEFFCAVLAAAPQQVLTVIEAMRTKRKRPPVSAQELLEKLVRHNLQRFVKNLRTLGYGAEEDTDTLPSPS